MRNVGKDDVEGGIRRERIDSAHLIGVLVIKLGAISIPVKIDSVGQVLSLASADLGWTDYFFRDRDPHDFRGQAR